jgi:TolB-like protein/DNA-binding winged helix-turn-helix (wHTH) protein/Tfp pilus assembly protein PilF
MLWRFSGAASSRGDWSYDTVETGRAIMPASAPGETFRFNDFELDVAAYQLRRQGRVVRLERQPMDVLILLVERRRQLVSRADIAERLWGKDVFVDVDTGVHTAIRKIRQALGDSISAPAFVETVPSKGYRFVADVEVVSTNDVAIGELHGRESIETAAAALAPAAGSDTAPASPRWSAHRARVLMAVVAVALVTGLVAWTRLNGGVPAARVTLAVLPFEYLGNDPEREYLAAGLTEETSASLAQIDLEHLIIKGRTLGYRGTAKTAAEIGRELSVDYLLESTLRAEGSRLRVTTTLIRVGDQEHVWSRSYDRDPTSLLGLQQELSTSIAEQIRLRLSRDNLREVRQRQTENADAYDAYLKGRYFHSRRTAATNALATREYERAIALDPNYALAWAGLAGAYTASTLNGDARPREVWPHAKNAADGAVRGNASLGETQLAVGHLRWVLDWDWKAAETACRLAIRLDPRNAAAHRSLGHVLSQSGQHTEAESEMRRARELEPLEPVTYALSAQVAFQARQYPAAVEHARRAILIDSQFWIGYMQLGQAYEQMGQPDLALAALTDAARFSGNNSKVTSLRGYLLAKTGRFTEAREVLRQLESDSRAGYVPPVAIALVHAGLGEQEAVMESLAKAYDARDVHLIYLPVDPKWDPYRADPRFQALLTRCGFTASTRGGPLSMLLPSVHRR